jgi:CO/xanthine dehydrogenase Mo-binding subunit
VSGRSERANRAAQATPRIVDAQLAAGHDGLAEVSVTVRYDNGAARAICLPCDVIDAALDRAGITDLTDLVGLPWTALAT